MWTKEAGRESTASSVRPTQPGAAVSRAPSNGGAAGHLLKLQRTRGNRYVRRLVGGAKLQPKCACGGTCGCGAAEEREVIRRLDAHGGESAPATTTAPAAVHEVLGSEGQPLDDGTREFMETRFGYDFGGVRIHTDSKASESAEEVGALAYTVGRDIVFASQQYDPHSSRGQRLLAHELAHVIQQGGQVHSPSTPIEVGDPSSAFEDEADEAADRAMQTPDSPHEKGDERGCPKCGSGEMSLDTFAELMNSLAETDEHKFARHIGGAVADKAIAVDGRWLSDHLGEGGPLDPSLQAEMEQTFGEDFSRVRIHTDDKAEVVARMLNAEAVTVGQHIAFADGAYNPHTPAGRSLLVHELAHTFQQRGSSSIPSGNVPLSNPLDRSEREADLVAKTAAEGPTGLLSRHLSASSGPLVNRSFCGTIVEESCWAAFSAIAAAIAVGCVAGTVVTVGGLAIPCTAVVIAGAGLAAWDAVMCTNILKQAICNE